MFKYTLSHIFNTENFRRLLADYGAPFMVVVWTGLSNSLQSSGKHHIIFFASLGVVWTGLSYLLQSSCKHHIIFFASLVVVRIKLPYFP
jgi:hypothetical protein